VNCSKNSDIIDNRNRKEAIVNEDGAFIVRHKGIKSRQQTTVG
jgi:hypothetical protein